VTPQILTGVATGQTITVQDTAVQDTAAATTLEVAPVTPLAIAPPVKLKT
jgi:hypothetical protein